MTNVLWLIALALAVPASASGQEPSGLAGSEWRVLAIAGETVPEGVAPIIQFRSDGDLTGTGGCNRFTGTYAVDGGNLVVSPLAATRMACPEPAMAIESRLFATLADVTAFARDRADMVLSGADDTPLLVLVQTDWD